MIRVFGITLECYLSRLSKWQSKHKTCYTLSMSRMTNKCYTRRAIIILVLVVLWPSCYSCYTRYLCYFWKLYSISCYCAILLPVVLSLAIFWLSCIFRYSAIKCVNYFKPAWAWDLSPTGWCSLTLRYLSLCSQVRPRMTHTLTRKGMTKSEARSTLESLCYLRVVVSYFLLLQCNWAL